MPTWWTMAWLLSLRITTTLDLPFFGQGEVVTTSVVLSQPQADGSRTWKRCSVHVQTDAPATTIIPRRFVDALPERTVQPVLQDGWLTIDPGVEAVGFVDEGQPIPSSRRDAAVLDHEVDGRPGATVLLDVPLFRRVRLGVIQRNHNVLVGEIAAGGARGRIEVRLLEQVTLSASVPGFRTSPKPTVVPDRTTFVLVPVPAETTCEHVVPKE
ncbi:MAG: hypothetical protein ACI9MC_001434 [Kiritimatiellia bacterium]|jgi:hypothetical protein